MNLENHIVGLCVHRSTTFRIAVAVISWCLLVPKLSLAQADYKHDVESLRKDFSIFRGALEESHVGVYWYRSKMEMDRYFDAAYLSLDSKKTELEFFRILAPVVSRIGCGHTWIATTESTQQKIWVKGKVLPLKLKFIARKAYCLQNNSLDLSTISPGDQILSINNFSIDSLLSLSNRFSPGDGFIEVGKWGILDKVFNQFYTLYLDQPDKYSIQFLKEDGQTQEIVIDPLTINQIDSIAAIRYPKKPEVESNNVELTFIADSIALLRVKEFDDWKSDGRKVSFRKELEIGFDAIKSAKLKNLVIDIRNNDGGNEKYGLLLYSYVTDKPFAGYRQIDFRTTRLKYRKYSKTSWREYLLMKAMLRHKKVNDTTYLLNNDKSTRTYSPKVNAFKGNLYFLINRGSFSTTSDFAALCHSNQRGIFFGE